MHCYEMVLIVIVAIIVVITIIEISVIIVINYVRIRIGNSRKNHLYLFGLGLGLWGAGFRAVLLSAVQPLTRCREGLARSWLALQKQAWEGPGSLGLLSATQTKFWAFL